MLLGRTMIASAYRCTFSRFHNASSWMRSEIQATKFDDAGMPIKWCIIEGGSVLNKACEWECNVQPSSRDKDFLARTRFNSAEEAYAFAENWNKSQNP